MPIIQGGYGLLATDVIHRKEFGHCMVPHKVMHHIVCWGNGCLHCRIAYRWVRYPRNVWLSWMKLGLLVRWEGVQREVESIWLYFMLLPLNGGTRNILKTVVSRDYLPSFWECWKLADSWCSVISWVNNWCVSACRISVKNSTLCQHDTEWTHDIHISMIQSNSNISLFFLINKSNSFKKFFCSFLCQ